MIRSAAIALSLLVLMAFPLPAQTGEVLEPEAETDATRVATRGANFLNLQVGARAQALAGAMTATPTGIEALYWNTGALGFEEDVRVGVSLSELYADLDIQHLFGGVILPLGESRFAVSVNQLTSGEISRTDEDFPEGGNPQFGAAFEWTSTAIGLHFGRLITDRLGFGVAGKFIQEGISGARAQFFAADVGLSFLTGLFGTQMGVYFFNLGPKGKIEGALVERQIDQSGNNASIFESRRVFPADLGTVDVELPAGFRIGITTQVLGSPEALFLGNPEHKLAFMLDVSDRTDSPLSPSVALQYDYREVVFIRGGKWWPNESQIDRDFAEGLSFGGGIAIPVGGSRILFDYAYSDVGELDNVQTFALEMAL